MKRFSFAVLTLVFSLVLAVTLSSPAWALLGSDDKAKEPTKTVYDALKRQKDLSKFVDMISDAGLKDMFQSKDTTITVFAPTNDAISNLSRADTKKIEANKDNLQAFIKSHVVIGSHITTNSMNGRKFSSATASGDMIAFDGTSAKDPIKVNNGHLVSSDINVGSNVMHTVSAAFVPSMLKDKEEAKVPEPLPQPAGAAEPATSELKEKGKSKSGVSSGSTVPVEATVPVSSSAPVGAAVAPAPSDHPAPSGGFSLFGHHFGSSN